MTDDTPMFLQYQALKDQHPDEVLFFRLGDFYEMFDNDALEVSKALNLTLTHRCGRHMCGVPFHAYKIYIARLLRLGKKVAIAEQIGEIAHGKGLTERKVIEVITPGTAIESEYLNGNVNNFLASAAVCKNRLGFAYIDVTTGDFKATSFPVAVLGENFPKEISRCAPRELLLTDALKNNAVVRETLEAHPTIAVSWYPDWNFETKLSYGRLVKQFKTVNLNSFSLTPDSAEVAPAGFLLDSLAKTTNAVLPHVSGISVYEDNQFVVIDEASRKNLEITRNLRDGGTEFTLLECLNYTATSMGMRMLRNWLSFPLMNEAQIAMRQDHVELFVRDRQLLKKIRAELDGILDMERLSGRIAMDRAHAKDLKALQLSLGLWLKAQQTLGSFNFASLDIAPAKEIISCIENAIVDDPATDFTSGSIIKDGWSAELDKWRDIHGNFNKVLNDYAEEERAKTGINGLKIRKNENMGYYIEVSRGKTVRQIPPHFIMKRALVNADRYTTERLQELEASLNESGTKIVELEHDLFLELRNRLKQHILYLRQTAEEVAYADVVSTLAEAAIRNNWVRPVVEQGKVFDVRSGRHPVVEQHIPKGEFVPNDLQLLSEDAAHTFALITGPNMAGKSTFLRQNALICLLAQIGSFVPCASARLGIVDRIFCRVGASDNLAKGESTFLVEMTETAHILRSATEHSFVIMDEVGRGTSTEDGLSIAWAVSEYLLNTLRCKTLFATHYHELTRLDHPLLKKVCMAVSENGSNVVFLRKVIDGASANSYGIHVARLAGVPEAVIKRASDILAHIQNEAAEKPIVAISESSEELVRREQQSLTGALFSDEELVLDEILSLDTDNTTPLAALQLLIRWKNTLSGR